MFKRPSSRRKSSQEGISLNLVPVLDAMVTLIGFLLFTMSFLALVSIESPFPQVNPKDIPQKIKEKPLQLTLSLREKDAEIWSPFERVKPFTVQNNPDGTPNVKAIHDALVLIKQKFPKELQIVFVPYAGANYEILIGVMDSIRMMDKADPPIFTKNEKTGIDEPIRILFPDVVFGNLLGDT